MKSLLFVCIVLVSGAISGTVQGVVNLIITEPVLDRAISIENKALFDSGAESDTDEFRIEHNAYRLWQKGGQVFASVILGMSMGSLFGLVYAYAKKSLPGSNAIKKSLILAVIMWLVLFLIPFIKYPANPPTVGDTETVQIRTLMYVGLMAISGLAAVGFYYLSKIMKKKTKLVSLFGYVCMMIVVLMVFPENPDTISAPPELLYDFRITSAIAIASFWITIPIILGSLWHRFAPDVVAD